MDFLANLKEWAIPEGNCKKVRIKNGSILWEKAATPVYRYIDPIDSTAFPVYTGLKSIVLNGSESWSATGGGCYTGDFSSYIRGQNRNALVGYSANYTFYPNISAISSLPEGGFMFNGTTTVPVNGNLSFKDTNTSSASAWKIWLEEHPITILISVNNPDTSVWKPAIRIADSVTGYWNGTNGFVPVYGGIPYYGDNLVTDEVIENYYQAYLASSGSSRYWRPATDTSRTIRLDVEAGKYYYAQWTETDSDIVGTVYRFGYTDIGEPKASTGNMVYDTMITTPQDNPSEIITATKAYMVIQFGGALFPENAGYFSVREMIGYEPPI